MSKLLLVLLFIFGTGFAHAGYEQGAETTYTVKKGDWLAKIAPNFGVTWNAIAKANNVKKPYVIYPDQTLRIPHTLKVSSTSGAEVFLWKNPGNAKCKDCTVTRSVQGLGYPDIVADILIAKVKNRDFTIIHITSGTHFDAMYFGKNIRKEHVIAQWKKGHSERAREYFVVYNETRYALVYPIVCGNWAKHTSAAPIHLTVGPPEKNNVSVDRVVDITPPQSPEIIPGQITEATCSTCPDFIILATFEPLTKKESYTTNSWNE